MKLWYLGADTAQKEYEKARVVVVPAPYEYTTSYMAGTAQGPRAVLAASPYLEFWDEELDVIPYEIGVYTDEFTAQSGNAQQDLQEIEKRIQEHLSRGKIPVTIGGEHTITLAQIRAFKAFYPQLTVLQLDAHADLRDQYEDNPLSHACVMRRIHQLGVSLVQVGLRGVCKREEEYQRAHDDIRPFYALEIREHGFSRKILDAIKGPVFISIDVDFFDPTLIPATGTPEPGGFFWYETLQFLKKVFQYHQVVGWDVVELSPHKGLVYPDFTVAKLIYKLISYRFFLNQ